jgi:GNAT superfamily N-acetyltransferase
MDQGVFEGGRWGRVHWVAILPEHQGQGLGSPLMTAICHRLRDLGHTRAFLRTAANRAAAIKLYLRFGFEPHPRNAEEERLWPEILARLGRAA